MSSNQTHPRHRVPRPGVQKILVVAGARPNFMKVAPLLRELRRHKEQFTCRLVHTGQHYDMAMSAVFFKNLNIPKPDIYLNAGSGSHAVQTARVMTAFEKALRQENPDWVIVVGDVNSTLACSITAAKLGVKVAHVEAGLRSFDRRMPEEINRLVTDAVADRLFVSEESGLKNLKKEGIASKKVHFVGNIMIDTLFQNMHAIDRSDIVKRMKRRAPADVAENLRPKNFGVLTLHRPSNVDTAAALARVFSILKEVCRATPLIYPIHPRTKKMLRHHRYLARFRRLPNLIMIDPVGYTDFIKLIKHARFVMTDSGGIQEETTVLNVPCITLRENTERPVTITQGTNILTGLNKSKIRKAVSAINRRRVKKGRRPKFWDGKTAVRIVKYLT